MAPCHLRLPRTRARDFFLSLLHRIYRYITVDPLDSALHISVRLQLTADAEDAAKDGVWEDPPDYFDNIVYPAYVKAHAHAFEGNDVESGRPTAESGIVLIDPPEGEEGMTRALGEACTALLEAAEERAGRVVEA